MTASGPKLSVLFNGQKLFEAVDPRPAAGRTGLAAAGPGDARFDEFLDRAGRRVPRAVAAARG